MKTLKKLTAVLLALTIALSICACSSQSNKNKSYVKATSTPKPSPTVFSIFSLSDYEIEDFVCSCISWHYSVVRSSSSPHEIKYEIGTIKREQDCIKVYVTANFYDEFGDRCDDWGRETNRFSDTYQEIIATVPDSLKTLAPTLYSAVDLDFR